MKFIRTIKAWLLEYNISNIESRYADTGVMSENDEETLTRMIRYQEREGLYI